MKKQVDSRKSVEYKAEVKAGFLSLLRTTFFLLLALVVLVAATIAWFASNKDVFADQMAISAKQAGFRLVTEGDKLLQKDLEQYVDMSLYWLLTADSHIENINNQFGIRPDTSGDLTFYVIPNNDETSLVINCTLDIRPVMKDSASASDTVTKIMRGHLLFACEYVCGDSTYQELVDVCNGTFQITIPNAKAGEKQLIHLKWFWPYTLYDANTHSKYGSQISAMTASQEYFDYFYYDNTGSANIGSPFKILNQHYNDADQFIGDMVDAVVVELSAVPANS